MARLPPGLSGPHEYGNGRYCVKDASGRDYAWGATDPDAVVRDAWDRFTKTHGSALPRRGDEDKRECTDAPVFLLQRRRLSTTLDSSALEWDSDRGCLLDEHGEQISDEEAVARGLAEWEWDTQSVAFTREEARAWTDAKAHRGPWRVYSVPSMGELRTLLRALTDYEEEGS